MGNPKLYCNEASPFSRTVLLTLKAIDFKIEQVFTNGAIGQTKTPEFIKMNPQHTIPLLETENGKYIVDSHAISVYLVNKYGKPEHQSLAPTIDLYERAVLESRLHFADGLLYSKLFKLLVPIRRGELKTFDEESKKSVDEVMDFLETFLQNGSYVCGNNLTVADFAIIVPCSMYFGVVPVNEIIHPKIADWSKRMTQLPYYDNIITKNIQKFVETMVEKLKEQ